MSGIELEHTPQSPMSGIVLDHTPQSPMSGIELEHTPSSPMSLSGAGGSDYNEIVEALTFNAVNTRFCVNISVVNDLADEEVESFSLMLVGDNMTAEATIVILDDGEFLRLPIIDVFPHVHQFE